MLKYVPVDNIVLDFINPAYDARDPSDQWNLVNIIRIPKPGDLTRTDHYRVNCSSAPAKNFNRRILWRTGKLPAIMSFVDFKAAFGTSIIITHRGKFICILRPYGIPEKLVQALSGSQ